MFYGAKQELQERDKAPLPLVYDRLLSRLSESVNECSLPTLLCETVSASRKQCDWQWQCMYTKEASSFPSTFLLSLFFYSLFSLLYLQDVYAVTSLRLEIEAKGINNVDVNSYPLSILVGVSTVVYAYIDIDAYMCIYIQTSKDIQTVYKTSPSLRTERVSALHTHLPFLCAFVQCNSSLICAVLEVTVNRTSVSAVRDHSPFADGVRMSVIIAIYSNYDHKT